VEQQRAVHLGADYFLAKPYNVETFSRTVKSIMDGLVTAKDMPGTAAASPAFTPGPAAAPQTSDLAEGQVRVTVWGARGFPKTIPNSASRHGRQTACVSVETRSNIFIFDAGTGIIPLGAEIAANKRHYKDIWIFLTHFHLGSIIGLSGFQPVYDPEFSIHIIGANDPEKSLKEVTQAAFYSSFAMAKQPPRAKLNIYEVLADSYEILPGVKLSGMYANHQTSTMAYCLEHLGKKIAYAADSEIWGDATAFQDYDERLAEFAKNSDLLIHDCMYSDADYEVSKRAGHSGLSVVVDFAGTDAQVKDLVLAHLNPGYSDEELDKMLSDANARIKAKGYSLNCHLAAEMKSFLLK
jgi:ribonuclease BN (tRNA processing enzyme)